ncbi:MAG TPA: STAS domain-containing protein [Solirubrobacteraceae bacterium]
MSQTSSGSSLTLSIAGELDMQTIEVLAARVDQNRKQQFTSLTLDLGELAFMDSSGLKYLIELNDRSQSEAWRLKLIRPRHAAAATVLRVTGADTFLPFEREAGP